VDGKENGLAPFAHQRLEMTDLDKALDLAQRRRIRSCCTERGSEKGQCLKKVSPRPLSWPWNRVNTRGGGLRVPERVQAAASKSCIFCWRAALGRRTF
jgi:hypothetical protein